MIYLGAPQNTFRRPISELKIPEFKKVLTEKNINIDNVIVHGPYVMNLANTLDEKIFNQSVDFLKKEIARMEEIGLKTIVIHPGSALTAQPEEGLSQLVRGINLVLKETSKVRIALETMCRRGNELGGNFEQLRQIIDKVDQKERVGGKMDRHENIGYGKIGLEALKRRKPRDSGDYLEYLGFYNPRTFNMLYSPEEKRKIILANYSCPSQQVELAELKKKSVELSTSFSTFRSLDVGCGDVLHLLIIIKGNYIEKCWFAGQQSCLITVAAANIICVCLEKKTIQFAYELINNCQSMIEGKEYDLHDCPDLQVFSDISNYPHRVECIKLTTDIEKIVLNSGVGQAINNKQFLENTEKALIQIAQGQKPILTYSHKSITAFKLREGMPIGCKVTLRKKRAWNFLFDLINFNLPLIANFQGFSQKKFDRDGNYNLGVDNLNIFSTVPYDLTFKNQGLQITIVFKSRSTEENIYFLNLLGFPFKEKN
ncbi:2886_t:CDS:2 [Entrophospora sp. SA101]|nr:2886_t:CDS:2 [Entrophospora sp. SA101]